MKHTLKLLALAAVAAASLLIPHHAARAQGSLMVNPKRVTLDARNRNGNITLFNSGDDSASYVISLLHYAMREDGSFYEIPDSIHTYAATYCDSVIRYFPLEVMLPPHESQAIHVRFMKPMDMKPGEYRSHMYFRAIEKAVAIEQKAVDTSQHTISLSLHPIFGISIPIIVRYNTSPDTVTLDSGFVSPVDTGGNGTVTALLNRRGDESCYGSLRVLFKDKGGDEKEVGIVKGIAVYVPLAARRVEVAYKMPKGVDPASGTFRLEYQTLTDNPHEQVLATADLARK